MSLLLRARTTVFHTAPLVPPMEHVRKHVHGRERGKRGAPSPGGARTCRTVRPTSAQEAPEMSKSTHHPSRSLLLTLAMATTLDGAACEQPSDVGETGGQAITSGQITQV